MAPGMDRRTDGDDEIPWPERHSGRADTSVPRLRIHNRLRRWYLLRLTTCSASSELPTKTDKPMITDEEKMKRREESLRAVENAKKVLMRGDRVRCTKCPGTKRTFTFERWDGNWMVSKSGIDDFAPSCVDMVNGVAVDFIGQNGSDDPRRPDQ